MNLSIKEIIELYGNIGLMAVIAIMVLYYVIIPKLKSSKKQEEINNKIYERKMLGEEDKSLLCDDDKCVIEHPFFKRCDNLIKFEANDINFGGAVRNLLFSDMLKAKIEIFSRDMFIFKSKHFETSEEWLEELQRTLEKTINDYNHKWVDIGAPKLAIDKFNCWHQNKVKNANDYIVKIALSSFYSTIERKNMAVLDMLVVLFNQTCEDMYDAAYALNGELTGFIYKGQSIEPLKH